MTEPAPGLVVSGRYELTRRLGAGGFGSVWLARDRQAKGIDRPVAIKILHPSLTAARGRDFERFRREAEVLSGLDHPAIARAIAYDLDGELAYIVMEHVDGLPLDKVLVSAARKESTVAVADAQRIFDELCAAVGYAHDAGIVHRDLKPQNVMIVRRGDRPFVKVLDFGIARVAGEAEDAGTTVGRLIGSYHYMAPEQIRGERVDHRVDVFALGAMLFELVTARRAWARDAAGEPLWAHLPTGRSGPNSLEEIMARIGGGPRPSPGDVSEGVLGDLDPVVAKALAVAKEERFGSAAALAEAARPAMRERRRGMTIVELEPAVRTALFEPSVEPDGSPPLVLPAGSIGTEPVAVADTAPAATPLEARGMPTLLDTRMIAPPMGARRGLHPALAALGGALIAGGGVWWAVRPAPASVAPAIVAPAVVTPAPEAPRVGAIAGATAAPSPSPTPTAESPRSAEPARPRAATSASPRVAPLDAGPPLASPFEAQIAAAARPGAGPAELAALADALRAALARRPDSPEKARLLRKIELSLVDSDTEGLVALARGL